MCAQTWVHRAGWCVRVSAGSPPTGWRMFAGLRTNVGLRLHPGRDPARRARQRRRRRSPATTAGSDQRLRLARARACSAPSSCAARPTSATGCAPATSRSTSPGRSTSRPAHLAEDLGRAAYTLIPRGLPSVARRRADLRAWPCPTTVLAVRAGRPQHRARRDALVLLPVRGQPARLLAARHPRRATLYMVVTRVPAPGSTCRWRCSPTGCAPSPTRRRSRRCCRTRSTSSPGGSSALDAVVGRRRAGLLAGSRCSCVGRRARAPDADRLEVQGG